MEKHDYKRIVIATFSMGMKLLTDKEQLKGFSENGDEYPLGHKNTFILGIRKEASGAVLVEDVEEILSSCPIVLAGDNYAEKEILERMADNGFGLLYHSKSNELIKNIFNDHRVMSGHTQDGGNSGNPCLYKIFQIIKKGRAMNDEDFNKILEYYNG